LVPSKLVNFSLKFNISTSDKLLLLVTSDAWLKMKIPNDIIKIDNNIAPAKENF